MLEGIRDLRIVDVQFVFFETPLFTRLLSDYLDDEAYRALQRELLRSPEHGSVIPRTGGFRKLRWADEQRGKGRRSGLRVIYYVLASQCQIWFFSTYGKEEADDLTVEQCRRLKNAIQQELRGRRRLS